MKYFLFKEEKNKDQLGYKDVVFIIQSVTIAIFLNIFVALSVYIVSRFTYNAYLLRETKCKLPNNTVTIEYINKTLYIPVQYIRFDKFQNGKIQYDKKLYDHLTLNRKTNFTCIYDIVDYNIIPASKGYFLIGKSITEIFLPIPIIYISLLISLIFLLIIEMVFIMKILPRLGTRSDNV